MPRFDRTGPQGQGPMTGRGMGPCNVGFGFRRGMGRGIGYGRFWGWVQPQTKKGQLNALRDYRKSLEGELEELKKEEGKLSNETKNSSENPIPS